MKTFYSCQLSLIFPLFTCMFFFQIKNAFQHVSPIKMTIKETLIVIMQSLQQQNEDLKQLLKAKSTKINAGKSHIFEKYDSEEEEFSMYLERFENYLKMRYIGSNPSADDDGLPEKERKLMKRRKRSYWSVYNIWNFSMSSLNSKRRKF